MLSAAEYFLRMGMPEMRGLVEQRQSMLPTPVLVNMLRLLQVNTVELARQVERAVETNPVLRRSAGQPCPSCGQHLRTNRCGRCASSSVQRAESAHRRSWREQLKGRLLHEVSAADRTVAEYLVESLDDRGLLPLDALPNELGHAARQVVDRVLRALVAVGPPGIGAASLRDCVIQQVDALVLGGQAPPLLGHIIRDHAENVAQGELQLIAVRLGVTEQEVRGAVTVLRQRVRPYVVLDGDDAVPAPVDMIISVDRAAPDRLAVMVPNSEWFGVELDSAFLLHARKSAAGADWVHPHHKAALELLRQIEVRASTLQRIGDFLAERQRNFLLGDLSAHRPLRRAEVAAALDLHASTVSRAVAGKSTRCPDGRTVPLSALFGASTGPTEILRQLMCDEPLASDSELQRLLEARGIVLARRTVAKYRASLREPARYAKPASAGPHAGGQRRSTVR